MTGVTFALVLQALLGKQLKPVNRRFPWSGTRLATLLYGRRAPLIN